MPTIAQYAILLLQNLPSLIEAGIKVTGIIEKGVADLKQMQAENRDPSPAEWDALTAETELLQAQIDASTTDV